MPTADATALAIAPAATPATAPKRYVLQTHAVPAHGPLVDYDGALNDEQRAVALCDDGPTLVVAGAGSGKTRALTYRVARLIETGTPPDRILLLTFTNKSSREMLSRVEQLCRIDLRRLTGGTFHHVAHELLREHAPRLGYADRFLLLDREDAKELMSSATADLGLGVGQRRFPRADVLADLYSTAVNTQRPIADVVVQDFPQFGALEEEERRLFYVAVTRARDELYLCYPILHEEADRARVLMKPSRFVDELPLDPAPPYEKWLIDAAPAAALPPGA